MAEKTLKFFIAIIKWFDLYYVLQKNFRNTWIEFKMETKLIFMIDFFCHILYQWVTSFGNSQKLHYGQECHVIFSLTLYDYANNN